MQAVPQDSIINMSERLEKQIGADLEKLRESCEGAEKLIVRSIRKARLDQTESGWSLAVEYRNKVQTLRDEMEEMAYSILQMASVQRSRLKSLRVAFHQSTLSLEAMWIEFEVDFAKTKKMHELWGLSVGSSQESLLNDMDALSLNTTKTEKPLLSPRHNKKESRKSLPAPTQHLSRGVPFEAQFSHVPRRDESAPIKKKKSVFFSFGSSDDTSSDRHKPLRPPVNWGPM